jgi:hypothetical protein
MPNDKPPPKATYAPRAEVLEEVHRRTAETKSGLPGLDNLLTLDQAILIAASAGPLPGKTPKK